MILNCKNCGEEEEFYRCEEGVKSYPVDSTGKKVDSYGDFEPDGYVYYECAICKGDVIPNE